jgi:hypothetical protein
MRRFFQRTTSFFLILSIIIGSGFAAAPKIALSATETVGITSTNQTENAQARAYTQGIDQNRSINSSGAAANIAGGALACSAGQILGQLLTSAISSGINALLGSTGVSTTGAPRVPITADGTQLEAQSRTGTAASTGTLDPTGFTITQPSWDSIAWCVINTIIEYLIDATIEWAKTGFNGNPAFIDNPEQFFTSLADQEAGAFIQELVSGVAKGGINVCQPFRVQIGINLARAYGTNGGGRRLSCSLDRIAGNFESFVNNNFQDENFYQDWFTVTQNDSNNFNGSYILGSDELYARVAARNNTAQLELGWNNGFLNFKHCEDKTRPESCVTDTPGTLVQSSLEKSLGIPKDRLVLAQKFDQLVTVLVNSLIKVALNEVLEGDREN